MTLKRQNMGFTNHNSVYSVLSVRSIKRTMRNNKKGAPFFGMAQCELKRMVAPIETKIKGIK